MLRPRLLILLLRTLEQGFDRWDLTREMLKVFE